MRACGIARVYGFPGSQVLRLQEEDGKPLLRIEPRSRDGESRFTNDRLYGRHAVFVAVLGMDGFAGFEFELAIQGQYGDGLPDPTDEVHFDVRFDRIEWRRVLERIEREASAQLGVDPSE